MSAPMVRAILDGRKTLTRRLINTKSRRKDGAKLVPELLARLDRGNAGSASPYGQPGDRLWVRETFGVLTGNGYRYVYRADGDARRSDGSLVENMKWGPSIHMPRKASRITLEVTGVRVERVQDISEADAMAEGVERVHGRDVPAAMGVGVETWRNYEDAESWVMSAGASFMSLWRSINGADSWAANPWVWVVEFKRVTP